MWGEGVNAENTRTISYGYRYSDLKTDRLVAIWQNLMDSETGRKDLATVAEIILCYCDRGVADGSFTLYKNSEIIRIQSFSLRRFRFCI